jgi:hypothetical protein
MVSTISISMVSVAKTVTEFSLLRLRGETAAAEKGCIALCVTRKKPGRRGRDGGRSGRSGTRLVVRAGGGGGRDSRPWLPHCAVCGIPSCCCRSGASCWRRAFVNMPLPGRLRRWMRRASTRSISIRRRGGHARGGDAAATGGGSSADRRGAAGLRTAAKAIIHGDALSASIAAASILAKVERDRMMCEWDAVFPEYGLASHKGYSTPQHRAALQEHGPTPLHRQSFAPVWKLSCGAGSF